MEEGGGGVLSSALGSSVATVTGRRHGIDRPVSLLKRREARLEKHASGPVKA